MLKVNLTNDVIVISILYDLGGSHKYVHVEDVALKCWKNFPKRFGWKKYPQYPDTKAALFALESLMKKENGVLAKGNSKNGYILTPSGIEWVKQNEKLMKKLFEKKDFFQSKLPKTNVHRIMDELENHIAFKKYIKDGNCKDIKNYELTDLLKCGLDTDPEIINKKLDKLISTAMDAGRSEFLNFLYECKKYFYNLIKK